jgi:DNA-binding CsgD family transcriptional regulator
MGTEERMTVLTTHSRDVSGVDLGTITSVASHLLVNGWTVTLSPSTLVGGQFELSICRPLRHARAGVAATQGALTPIGSPRRLSPRQTQILEFVQSGLSTRAIAARIGRSVKTVGVFRTQIRQRLGLSPGADLCDVSLARTDDGRHEISAPITGADDGD